MLQRCWLAAVLTLGVLALPAHGQVAMEWKLKEGDKFYLETVSTFKQVMRTLGRELKQDLEQTTVFGVTVTKKDADGSFVLEQKIEALMIKNAAGTAGGTDDKFNQQLIGAVFKVTVSPKGEVTKFEGYDDLVKKVVGDDAAARKVFQAIMPEEYSKRSAAEAFAFLPDKPVKTADNWERKLETSLGPLGSFSSKRTYTYEGRETAEGKDLEKITFTAATTYNPPTPPKSGEPPAFAFQVDKGDLKVEDYKGTVWFDAAAGRLARSEWSMRVRGTVVITVSGTKIDTEAQQDQTVKIRLLDKNPAAK